MRSVSHRTLTIAATLALTLGGCKQDEAVSGSAPSADPGASGPPVRTTQGHVRPVIDTDPVPIPPTAAPTRADAAVPTTSPTGDDRKGVQDLLAQVTNAALTKGGLDDMTERFDEAARVRISAELRGRKFDVLDGRIDQFRKDWHAHYGRDFRVQNPTALFGASFLQCASSPLETASRGPKLVGVQAVGLEVDSTGAATTRGAGTTRPTRAGAAILKPLGGPALRVPMVYETAAWRVHVPDSLDGANLADHLLKTLTKLNEAKDSWAANADEQMRVVAREVMGAVVGEK